VTTAIGQPLLKMKDIRVAYDSFEALKGVDFTLRAGEIHAIVGEHRAGKSSLVKVLAGSFGKYSGDITLRGKNYVAFNERMAIDNRITMFYQGLNVIPTLSAVQNIFLSKIPKRYGIFSDYGRMNSMVRGFMRTLDLDFNIATPLMNLPIGVQNMVELIKVFLFDPEIIILDEISSRLTPIEMEKVYPYILERKSKGTSIIYITHYMNEVFQFADRVTVLKNGTSMGTEEIRNIDNFTLYRMAYSFVLTRNELQEDNIKLYYLKMYNEQIIRNLPIGVIILDPLNAIYLINNSALTLIGAGDDVFDRGFSSLLEKLSGETRDDMLSKIRQATEFTWEEIQFESKHVRVKYFPFKDSLGTVMGNIILIEDISKDVSFREYYIRTQKVSSIAELAAGIAHEINNPLGIIKNYVTLLKLEAGNADALPLISKISAEIERIKEIIASLLSFSKLTSKTGRSMDLASALNETIVLLEHKMAEKSIVLTRRVPETPTMITGDENRIRQVFVNLLMNSVEAVDANGTIEVELRRKLDDGVVEVLIADNGRGIDESIRDMVFEPFFTDKEGKNNTGLGLTICHHIVQAHDGVIYFESVPGVRTVFTVAFPLVVDAFKEGVKT
jgi:two-component system sensor histidine kinase AtoS